MNLNPLISVIIPVYNVENYLDQCLTSVVTQTLHDIEIIIINDGSTDGSANICRMYAEKDNRIKLINQKNQGAAISRNNGIKVAKGKYISFLDADDYFETNMFEKLFLVAFSGDLDIAICSSRSFYGDDLSKDNLVDNNLLPENKIFSGLDCSDNLFQLFHGWAWDKIFKREFISSIGILFQNTPVHNDTLFTYFSLAKAERIAIIDEIYVHHRERLGSLSSKRDKTNIGSVGLSLNAVKDKLKDEGIYNQYSRSFIEYVSWMCKVYLEHKEYPEGVREHIEDVARQFNIKDIGN